LPKNIHDIFGLDGPAGHGVVNVLLGDTQEVKDMIEIRFGQGRIGHTIEAFFRIVSDPQASLGKHQGIIGTVSDCDNLVQRNDQVARHLIQEACFLSRVDDIPVQLSGEHAVFYVQLIRKGEIQFELIF
jgi:hypothetical protein